MAHKITINSDNRLDVKLNTARESLGTGQICTHHTRNVFKIMKYLSAIPSVEVISSYKLQLIF